MYTEGARKTGPPPAGRAHLKGGTTPGRQLGWFDHVLDAAIIREWNRFYIGDRTTNCARRDGKQATRDGERVSRR